MLRVKEKLLLPSIIEIRSEDYLNQNEIEYDINNDGYKEKVICDYWHRWNSLSNCKIKFSNSYEIGLEGYGGKWLGILPSKKNDSNIINQSLRIYKELQYPRRDYQCLFL